MTQIDSIHFYQQLYKSLDDDSDDENDLCQITGFPLDSKCVTLECKHKFNYEPLYKEICRQKFVFGSYDWHVLSNKERVIIRNKNVDYFIRCPYCRNIQFSVLPYYEELGLKQKYGINSLDESLSDKPTHPLSGPLYKHYASHVSEYTAYGKLYKKGTCGLEGCLHKYVTLLLGTELTYCQIHYQYGLKKIKDDKAKEKQKLLEKQNEERAAQGLKPLKRLPPVKKQNVVQQGIEVGTYIPETDAETQELTKTVFNSCKALLKRGPNKGKVCGCKKTELNGLCKRHQEKEKEKEKEKENEKNPL
jgi:hypothetical protein